MKPLLLALLLVPAGLPAGAPAAPAGVPAASPGAVSASQPAPAAEVGLDEKLGARIPLDLVLKAEDGSDVTLRSLVDRPTLITLNYFRCAGICTPQLTGVAEVLKRTQVEPGKDFRVVTVSFDERDTAEIAATKRANYLREVERPMAPEAWRFLTGNAAATKALCDAVGFKFRREGDDFVHPGVIVFVSPDGMVTRYMYGTTYLPADLQAAVGEAARSQPTPTITKFLKICFSYDPVGRKYVFSATKAGALLVLAGAIAFVIWLVRPRRRASLQTGETK